MTITVGTANTQNADDATFRSTMLLVHQGIVSGGLDNVECPNQIDFETALRGALNNTKVGFRIYQFTDILQDTTPIYLRVDYGTGYSYWTPGFWFTGGFAYDPSGSMLPTSSSISGTINSGGPTLPEFIGGTTTAANDASCSFAGDGSQFAASIFYQQFFHDMMFTIERTKDPVGNDDGRGFLMSTFSGGTSGVSSQVKYISGSAVGGITTAYRNTKLSTLLGAVNPRRFSGSFGDITPVSPIFVDGETSRQAVTAQVLDFSPFEYQDVFVEFPEGQIPFRVNGVNFGVAAYFANSRTQRIAVRFQG